MPCGSERESVPFRDGKKIRRSAAVDGNSVNRSVACEFASSVNSAPILRGYKDLCRLRPGFGSKSSGPGRPATRVQAMPGRNGMALQCQETNARESAKMPVRIPRWREKACELKRGIGILPVVLRPERYSVLCPVCCGQYRCMVQ